MLPKEDIRRLFECMRYFSCTTALLFIGCAVTMFVKEYESDRNIGHIVAHSLGIISYLAVIVSEHPSVADWSMLCFMQYMLDLIVVMFVGENDIIRDKFRTSFYYVYQMFVGVFSAIFSTILGQHTSSNSQHVLINGLTSAGILLFSLSFMCDDYGGSSFFTSFILSYIVTTKENPPYFQMILYSLIPASKYIILPICESVSDWLRDEHEKEMMITSMIQNPDVMLKDIIRQSIRDLRLKLDCAKSALQRTANDLVKLEGEVSEVKDKNSTLRGEVERLKDEISDGETAHKTEIERLKKSIETEQGQVKDLNERNFALEIDLSKVNRENQKLEGECQKLREEVDKLKEEISNGKTACESLKKGIETEQGQVKDLNERNSALEIDLSKVNVENQKLEGECQMLREEVDKLKEEISNGKTACESLKKDIKTERISALEMNNNTLDNGLTEKIREVEAKDILIETFSSKVDFLKKEVMLRLVNSNSRLDQYLVRKIFIFDDKPTMYDVNLYAMIKEPDPILYPNANRWYRSVSSKLKDSFPGEAFGVTIDGNAAKGIDPAEEGKD